MAIATARAAQPGPVRPMSSQTACSQSRTSRAEQRAKEMSRVVRANIVLSLDGRYHGPGGAGDMAAIVPYAVTDVARDFLTKIWQGATTVVLSRGNAEGFMAYWSEVARDDNADP